MSALLSGFDARTLGQASARAENRATTMATQLERLLQRMARFEAEREAKRALKSRMLDRVFKVSEKELEAELRRILTSNGQSAFRSSVRRTTSDRKADPTDEAMRDFMASKDIRLKQIMASTREAVVESVRQIILTALAESPRPSTGEIARRIRSVYHGDTGARPTEEVPAPLINSRVLPTTRVRLDNNGNLYAFSSERAALIARTEMAQAENEGIVDGYRQSGVTHLGWLAYNDGRSGRRQHNKMNGKIVRLGEDFVLPDGTKMPYPGYWNAPIKHLANCRCTVKAVRR